MWFNIHIFFQDLLCNAYCNRWIITNADKQWTDSHIAMENITMQTEEQE